MMKSAIKIIPVVSVLGSDVEMVPIDLAAHAEAAGVEKNYTATAKICNFATAKLASNSRGGATKATGALRNVALVVWSSSAEHVLQM